MDATPPYAASSRRRITRTMPGPDQSASTASSLQAGPSRLPDLTQLVDVNLSGKIEDTESDDHSTPRLPASSKLPASTGETPAARLRALLSLVPNHSMPVPPPESATEYESDFDRGESINATTSMARESLRDVFSRALRAPGGTPQKQRQRRNSIDPSDLESTDKERSKGKVKRKSLSDEEVENSYRSATRSQPTYKTRGQPLTLEVLQQRYFNNNSNTDDDALSTSDKHTSEDTADLLRELNLSRASPPNATSTPQHSLQLSVNLEGQLQSNLLDQDSDMQRMVEGLDSFEDHCPTQSNRVSFPNQSEGNLLPIQNATRPETAPQSPSRLPVPTSSRKAASPKVPENQSHNERSWSFPRVPRHVTSKPQPITEINSTPLTSRSLAALSRTISSPKLSVGSSRSGSVVSNTDHRERVRDLDQDILHQRERQWGKATPTLKRRTSNISLNSHHSAERPRTHSLSSSTDSFGSRGDSPSKLKSLRRHASHMSIDSQSPTGSAHSSQEEIAVPEVVHERERNWNSPRQVWHGFSPKRPDSPSLSTGNSSHSSSHARARTTSFNTLNNLPHSSASITSPTLGSRVRHHSSAGLSRPLRSHASSPSVPGNRLTPPTFPSIRKQSSTANLRHQADSQKILRSTKTSSPSTGKLRPIAKSSHSINLFDNTTSMDQHIKLGSSFKSPEVVLQVPKPCPEAQGGASEGETLQNGSERPPTGLAPHTDEQDDIQSQELTPTLRTVAPPPSDSPERPHAAGFPPDDLIDQHSLRDVDPELDASTNALPEMPSFLATPPRPPSSSLRLQFTSPSPPPQPLPPLPDLPTDDEPNYGSQWSNLRQSRLFDTKKISALQTPRAPGAWIDTPAPARRPRSYSDTSLGGNSFEKPDTQGPGPSGMSMMQTPRPPGGWHATPGPSKAQYVDQSVETDTENDTEPESAPIGLATPTTSLSKAFRDAQNPVAPGGWEQTPANRKSVMKVRFDPDANETRLFRNGESDTSVSDAWNASSISHEPPLQTISPPDTPELVGLPLSSSVRKTPSIRILDAYGNEHPEEKNQNTRKHSSRGTMIDELGQSIEEGSSQDASSSQSLGSIPRGSLDELLSRVRRGLNELAQEIHERDRATPSPDLSRVKELDSVSLNAREKRRRLSGEIKKNNDEFKDKFSALRASMQRNPLLDSSAPPTPSRFSFSSPRLLVLCALQIALAYFLYRLSLSRAKELFLTTYYDPFFPDLHLSLFKSRLFLSTSPEQFVSWITLYDLFREQGFMACAAQARDNLFIVISNIQTSAWERWGTDGASQNLAWPPT